MPSIRRVARARLPTSHGGFGMFVYEATDSKEHVALISGFEPGTVREDEAILVRLHSECLTGDVFGSRRCDCGEQLEDSMRSLREDARDYKVAAEMLLDLGVHRAALLTNNPAKIKGLRSHGIEVVERLPVQVEPNSFNLSYLRTKKEKLGHLFPASILHGGLPDERPNGPANGAS